MIFYIIVAWKLLIEVIGSISGSRPLLVPKLVFTICSAARIDFFVGQNKETSWHFCISSSIILKSVGFRLNAWNKACGQHKIKIFYWDIHVLFYNIKCMSNKPFWSWKMWLLPRTTEFVGDIKSNHTKLVHFYSLIVF